MKAAREAWFEGQLDLNLEVLVFLDETAANTSMVCRYGRARAASVAGSPLYSDIGRLHRHRRPVHQRPNRHRASRRSHEPRTLPCLRR